MGENEIFKIKVTVTLPNNLGIPKVTKLSLQSMEDNEKDWTTLEDKIVPETGGGILVFEMNKEMPVRASGKYAFRLMSVQPMWGKTKWWEQNYKIDQNTGSLQIDLSEASTGTTTTKLTTTLLSNFTQLSSGDGRNDNKFYCDDIIVNSDDNKIVAHSNVKNAGECARKCSGECMFIQYIPSSKQCKTYSHTGINNALVQDYANKTISSKGGAECWVSKMYMKHASARTCNKLGGGFQQTVIGCAPGWKWGDFTGCDAECNATTSDDARRAWDCKYCDCKCKV